MDEEHQRPEGATDATVEALGKLSEALEVTEVARGHLYQFHRLTGRAHNVLLDAVQQLRDAGHDGIAGELEERLTGLNVLEGRWTFQIVEEYDDGYYATWRELEEKARGIVGGKRHLFEAEMKQDAQE